MWPCLGRWGYFFPNASFFFPIIKRLAVNFMHRSFGDLHVPRLSGHEEINVVGRAVGGFHIDAGKIFAIAKTREPVVMNFD